MPEYPEVKGQQYIITKGKGSGFLNEAYGNLTVRFLSHLKVYDCLMAISSLHKLFLCVSLWAPRSTLLYLFPLMGTTTP